MKKYKPESIFNAIFDEHISVIDEIRSFGYKAYFIGGCVRDAIMGKKPYDFDLATNAKPENIMNIFNNFKETGISFGTVTVHYGKNNYEITTFRKEYGYSDNRKPDLVVFSDRLYDDVRRRDFTINALAYDGSYIYDYYNSYNDINNRIIKTIGLAERRFAEDALRILRAARFACVLDFEIDCQTLKNMRKYSFLLKSISKERIYSEVCKIIESAEDLNILFDTMIAENIFEYPQYINRKKLKKGSFECRLTDVFTNYPDDENIIQELKNLRADNKIIKTVTDVIKYSNTDTDEQTIRKLLTLINENSISVLLEYKSQSRKVLYEIIQRGYIKSVNDLEISGHDIIAMGFPKERIKEIKRILFEKVLEDISLNTKEKLIDMINAVYNNPIVKQ